MVRAGLGRHEWTLLIPDNVDRNPTVSQFRARASAGSRARQSSERWRCSISLSFHGGFAGRPLAVRRSTGSSCFGSARAEKAVTSNKIGCAQPIIDLYCRILKCTIAVCLAVMVVLVFGNVVLRYAFSVSEELSRWLMVWLCLDGRLVALRRRGHHCVLHSPLHGPLAQAPGDQRASGPDKSLTCWPPPARPAAARSVRFSSSFERHVTTSQ